MIKELFKNAALTNRLKPKYYRLTSAIGLVGVGIGLGVGVLALSAGAEFFGVDTGAPAEGVFNTTVMLVSIIFIFTFSIYAGCAVVAGIFSMFMLVSGRFTLNQAVAYTFLSRYPRSWLKETL